jgi:chemotaxis protein MotB
MTSLAVIFVLLLVVTVSTSRSNGSPPPSAAQHPQPEAAAERVWAVLQQALPSELSLERDPANPGILRIAIPASVLNFEFGKSTLAPAGDRFLTELMPQYAVALCGALRDQIAGIVIEGHTDDLGGDALNLKLSQERSFHVLVRGLEAISTTAPTVHACFSRLASASGRGKQDLVYDDAGRLDPQRSRRVVLKILLRPADA